MQCHHMMLNHHSEPGYVLFSRTAQFAMGESTREGHVSPFSIPCTVVDASPIVQGMLTQ